MVNTVSHLLKVEVLIRGAREASLGDDLDGTGLIARSMSGPA